jgi:hypothetical protein
MHTSGPSILAGLQHLGRSLPLGVALVGLGAAPLAALPGATTVPTTGTPIYQAQSTTRISGSTVIVIDGGLHSEFTTTPQPSSSWWGIPSRRPSTSPVITRSRIEDSVLINPTIIDSRIEDSVLINPRFERPSTPPSTLPRTRPACQVMAHLRTACQ